jgi:hypothetical protein
MNPFPTIVRIILFLFGAGILAVGLTLQKSNFPLLALSMDVITVAASIFCLTCALGKQKSIWTAKIAITSLMVMVSGLILAEIANGANPYTGTMLITILTEIALVALFVPVTFVRRHEPVLV